MTLLSKRKCKVHHVPMVIKQRLRKGKPYLYTICLHCDNDRTKRNTAKRKEKHANI